MIMADSSRIYFDHAATTPLDPQVAGAMQNCNRETYGNPSSLHLEGRTAATLLNGARHRIGTLLGAVDSDVIFTASGTEADNMALLGTYSAWAGKSFHLVTSAIEHPAILETCKYLESLGGAITYVRPAGDGRLDPDEIAAAITPTTRLISIMAANNVTGVVQPLAPIASLARDRNIPFHTDAVQAFGHIPLDWAGGDIAMLSLSGHKLHGPKGVGALVMRPSTPFVPLIHGGGQESGRRSATENLTAIIGLAKAAEIAFEKMTEEASRLVGWRDRLFSGLQEIYPGTYLIGHPQCRLPSTLCLGFSGLEGEAIKMLLALDEAGIAVSSGSACSSHKAGQPSYVLTAMGFDPIRARGSLRLSLGRFTTMTEIDRFLAVIPAALARMNPTTTLKTNHGG
jgi:cysteine desulfurase